MKDRLDISTDKARLDLHFIHSYLSEESYWAKGRTLEDMRRSIEYSTCFGGYLPDGRQVAFARIVTDQVVFAWLMDVFVSPSVRGLGYGKQLVAHILDHPDLRNVNGIGLRTEDAHSLYRHFGFEEIPKVHTWMLKKKPNQEPGIGPRPAT